MWLIVVDGERFLVGSVEEAQAAFNALLPVHSWTMQWVEVRTRYAEDRQPA